MSHRILVVEDDKKVRDWIVESLRAAGFQAAGLGNGVDALKVITGSKPPHLTVLDIELPGMNGIEVLRHMRAHPVGKAMPVIVITGVYKGIEYARKARQMFYVDAYMEKPFEIKALIQRINRAIEIRGKSNPSARPADQPAPDAGKNTPSGDVVIEEKSILKGTFQETPFDRLLLRLWKERHTGILRVSHNERDGEVLDNEFAFLSGRPVQGRSEYASSAFGDHLISRGLATPEENREYLALMARGVPDAEEIFIGMGCLTPDGFIVERVRHLEELLIGCFTLHEGDFVFEARKMEVGAVAGANVPRVLHEGYSRHLDERRIGDIFNETAGKYLCRTESYYDYIRSLELDPDELSFVREVTGSRMLKDHITQGDFYKILKTTATMIELGMVSPEDSPSITQMEPPYMVRENEPVNQVVCVATTTVESGEAQAGEAVSGGGTASEEAGGFENLGAMLSDELGDMDLDIPGMEPRQENDEHTRLEEELREESRRLKGKDYYEYFETTIKKFRMDEVKKTYFEKRKKFTPENFIMWASGDLISMAEQVFTELNTAYNTLSNVVSKEKYDELLESKMPKVTGDRKEDLFQSKVSFESGKAFVEMEDFGAAEQSLREAVSLAPDIAKYRAWLGWAMYGRHPEIPSNVNRANREIAEAIRMDPRCAIAFAFKGAIILEQGDLDRAEIELKKALKFNPRSSFARRKMKLLQERRENEKKGILGRIFS